MLNAWYLFWSSVCVRVWCVFRFAWKMRTVWHKVLYKWKQIVSALQRLCSNWQGEKKKEYTYFFFGVSMLLETVGPGPPGTVITWVNINNSSFSGRMVLRSYFLAVIRADWNRLLCNVRLEFLGRVSRQAHLTPLRFATSERLKWEQGLGVFS